MKTQLTGEYGKRYRKIVFVALPVCFAVGYFLSTKLVSLLDYTVNLKGKIVVLAGFIPLYLMGIRVAKRELIKRQTEDKTDLEIEKNGTT